MARLAVLLGIVALCNSSAFGGDFYPLSEGVQWTYEEIFPTFTDTFSVYFEGTAEINGALTHVQRFTGDLDRLREYWSQDSEGRVYLHGWELGPSTCLFSPPALMLDAPLTLGKKWTIDTMSSLLGPVTGECEVVGIGPVTVPAGTFLCTTIRSTNLSPNGGLRSDRTPLGLRPATGEMLTSYADGVGEIMVDVGVPSRLNRLISYGVRVAVQSMTWSAMRQMYK